MLSIADRLQMYSAIQNTLKTTIKMYKLYIVIFNHYYALLFLRAVLITASFLIQFPRLYHLAAKCNSAHKWILFLSCHIVISRYFNFYCVNMQIFEDHCLFGYKVMQSRRNSATFWRSTLPSILCWRISQTSNTNMHSKKTEHSVFILLVYG